MTMSGLFRNVSSTLQFRTLCVFSVRCLPLWQPFFFLQLFIFFKNKLVLVCQELLKFCNVVVVVVVVVVAVVVLLDVVVEVVVFTLNRPFYPAPSVHPVSVLIHYTRTITGDHS